MSEQPSPYAILIAGPTASGKSSLAMAIAARVDGEVVNADALQVYGHWSILTARPEQADLARVAHHQYGHVPLLTPYSVGHWLRETRITIAQIRARKKTPIIVGGTGLYFGALLNGLAEIPNISAQTIAAADALEQEFGRAEFAKHLAEIDPKTAAKIDLQNPARTRRAWEVFKQTGRGLADWQEDTEDGVLANKDIRRLSLVSKTNWLDQRIETRFDKMIEMGALDECRQVLKDGLWVPEHPSCRAIGADYLMAYLADDMSLDAAKDASYLATRRYAKRQRTWQRNRMSDWEIIQIDQDKAADDIVLSF